ncbi:DUF973 family protein [Sulfuracidifex metallicus]|uniref:DUF973 family protein n=1 Tax=Sulfuracidifex metallicus TaxID=47303 RepID=UPI0022732C2F|nr:DUF973 family protein [Sulfuracidifex metallicus]MCY0851051.1 DUF973 family protein [Sulfuracidifex metallicus]
MAKPNFDYYVDPNGNRSIYFRALDLILANPIVFVPSIAYLVISVILTFSVLPAFLVSISLGLVVLIIIGLLVGIVLAGALLITQSMITSSMRGVSPSLSMNGINLSRSSGVVLSIVGAYLIDYLLGSVGLGALGTLITLVVIVLLIPALAVEGGIQDVLRNGYLNLMNIYRRDGLLALLIVLSSILVLVPILNIFFIPYSIALYNLASQQPIMNQHSQQTYVPQTQYQPQVYQTGPYGALRADGMLTFQVFANVPVQLTSALIEGLNVASSNISPSVLSNGVNDVTVNFGPLTVSPNSVYNVIIYYVSGNVSSTFTVRAYGTL